MPFYQSVLGDRLEYELTFNDYSRAIRATGDADASYDIENISQEYEIVTQPELARMIANQYNGRLAILYDRILRHQKNKQRQERHPLEYQPQRARPQHEGGLDAL